MKFSFAIEIENSPEEVFYWLKDPEKAKEWMTSVSETEMLSFAWKKSGSGRA